MRSKTRILLSMVAAGLLLVGVATESLGQSGRAVTREPVLRGNPRRDAGGSCVYDKDGKVLYAPKGKHCPDATDHVSKPRGADSPIVASYPPAMRGELTKLLGDHNHIAQEIARLRQALESRNREVALEAVNRIGAEVTDHRAREERFLEKMAPNPASR